MKPITTTDSTRTTDAPAPREATTAHPTSSTDAPTRGEPRGAARMNSMHGDPPFTSQADGSP